MEFRKKSILIGYDLFSKSSVMVTPNLFSDKVLCFLMSFPVETTGQGVLRNQETLNKPTYISPITLLKK